jgi:hypothetical protein
MCPKDNMEYSKFHIMFDPSATKPYRLTLIDDEWVTMHRAYQLFAGNVLPPEPIKFRAYRGTLKTDFLWTTMIPLLCISSKTIDVLNENNIRGWSVYPVTVYDRQGIHLSDYSGFSLTSWAGDLEYDKSSVIVKDPVVPGGKPGNYYKGFFFDLNKWDGSDLFRVAGGFVVATERTKLALISAHISNIRFISVLEKEMAFYE